MVKILIIGDSAVGKSSTINKFCEGLFSHTHIATIGIDFKIKTIDVQGKKVKMQIWDTAGQEKYKSIVQTFYKGAMGIMIVYSCGDRKSFANVEGWMSQINDNTAPDIVKVLVGNKSDLEDREVSFEEGRRLAEQYNIQFFETSAKTGKNVHEAFHEVARQIKEKVGDVIENKTPGGGQKLKVAPVNPNPNVPAGGCKC